MEPTLEQTTENEIAKCKCGIVFNLAERMKDMDNTGNRHLYHSDTCWVQYTSSDDTLDPVITGKLYN